MKRQVITYRSLDWLLHAKKQWPKSQWLDLLVAWAIPWKDGCVYLFSNSGRDSEGSVWYWSLSRRMLTKPLQISITSKDVWTITLRCPVAKIKFRVHIIWGRKMFMPSFCHSFCIDRLCRLRINHVRPSPTHQDFFYKNAALKDIPYSWDKGGCFSDLERREISLATEIRKRGRSFCIGSLCSLCVIYHLSRNSFYNSQTRHNLLPHPNSRLYGKHGAIGMLSAIIPFILCLERL